MTMLVKRSTRESVRSLFRLLNGVDLLQSAPPHLRHFIVHGYTFYSQTDTEVVIKLVDYYYNNSDYLQKARKYGHFTGYKN